MTAALRSMPNFFVELPQKIRIPTHPHTQGRDFLQPALKTKPSSSHTHKRTHGEEKYSSPGDALIELELRYRLRHHIPLRVVARLQVRHCSLPQRRPARGGDSRRLCGFADVVKLSGTYHGLRQRAQYRICLCRHVKKTA